MAKVTKDVKRKSKSKEPLYHSKDGHPYLVSRVGEKIHDAIQDQKKEAFKPKSPTNKLKGGGMATRGLGRAFLKGGRA